MNTRDLQYFTAVVETKNYTQVAGQFGVAQPTVTQAIQRLEREFDVQLVDVARGRRGMKITRAGQLLYQAADRINHQLALAQSSINQAKRGSIRFGLPPIIGKIYISGLVKSCPPDLLSCLRITDQGSHELLKRLKNGQIDIAILGSMAPINEEGIFVDLVAKRPFTVAVSEQHPLAKKRRVAFGDLANERFINYSDQYIHRAAFNAYCDAARVRPESTLYPLPNISWVKELVRQNLGVSLIVLDAIKDEPGIVPLELTDPTPASFYISVATREGYVLSEDEQTLVTTLKHLELFSPA